MSRAIHYATPEGFRCRPPIAFCRTKRHKSVSCRVNDVTCGACIKRLGLVTLDEVAIFAAAYVGGAAQAGRAVEHLELYDAIKRLRPRQ